LNSLSITGLDIGSTKVCAIVAEIQNPESHDIVITGCGVYPCDGLRAGVIVDAAAVIQAIEQAVDLAGRQAGMDVESVYVSVTGAHMASLTSTGRATIANSRRGIGKREVDEVVEASRKIVLPPDRQIVHAIPISFTIDSLQPTVSPIGMLGQRLEVQTHIVHGSTAMIRNVEKCVTGAGLDIDEAVLAAIAAGESVLLPEEKESGVCLLDIGGSSSNLGVFVSGEILHSAVIPVGGNHVTNDIAYGLTVVHSEAERLKIDDGTALVDLVSPNDIVSVRQVGRDTARKLRRRALIQIIEPRMQELFQLAIDELTLANCLDKMPCGLVITGGGSLLNGCMEMLHQMFGMPVRLGSACRAGGINSTLKQPGYATAIGLAQYGARRRQAATQPSEVPKQDTVRTIWSQLVQSIKRTVPPR
jgi:cell division protein FtsA